MALTAADPDEKGDNQPSREHPDAIGAYRLDAQIGFQLRRAGQRHLALFTKAMPDGITARQWAALARLQETGPSPQNLLGRRTAMDAATIKGVVDRLAARGFVTATANEQDARHRVIALTAAGGNFVRNATQAAHRITAETLAPLTPDECVALLALLKKIS